MFMIINSCIFLFGYGFSNTPSFGQKVYGLFICMVFLYLYIYGLMVRNLKNFAQK